MDIIKVKNLCFKYNEKSKRILNQVNFSCEEGSVNVLIGLNGSGKTTLLKILTGLMEKYQGEVEICGKSIKLMTIKERSQKIAYVPQINNAIEDFKVLDYLMLSTVNKTRFYQSPKDEWLDMVKRHSEEFKISNLLDKKLLEISGGERQMVAICAAIIQDTNLIVLDEPTSALDIKNQQMVLNIIKTVAKTKNKTFILSSHNPNHALSLNANVILLKEGKIVKTGRAVDVIRLENLREIYGDLLCYSKDLQHEEISFKI